MIESLTPEQQARFPEFVKKWLDIGLSTGDCDFERAKKAVKKVYKAANLEEPELFFLADSPPGAAKMATKLCAEAGRDDKTFVQHYGCQDANWLAFYDFFGEVCKIDVSLLDGLFELARCCGWWIPFKGAVIFQHKPDYIHMKDGRLHCETGPAIHYRDGFAIWALNGVRVPQWLVETPDTQLDPKKIIEIENAQVRAEFVRKVGVERLCYALKAKTIDTLETKIDERDIHYDLLEFGIGNSTYRYLKMNNPSCPEVWHVEGVPPDCLTVRAALLFRNGLTEDQIDDENGAEWRQQGDVTMFPVGAKKFKLMPSVLR